LSSIFLALLLSRWKQSTAFSATTGGRQPRPQQRPGITSATTQHQPAVVTPAENNNVLILDHLNINHERGRHDWLKAFYFDFLRCTADPHKQENLTAGKKTVWANIGANQFHLPEGNQTHRF
jgi:hypothetical protein